MSTLEQMTSRIADDLNRSDLDTQIKQAINRAITHYKPRAFWFSEASQSFTLQASVYQYTSSNSALPSEYQKADLLEVTVNGNPYPIKKISFTEIKYLMSGSSITGYPQNFAEYGGQLWIYPIPNQSLTATLYYQKNYTTLSASSDTNEFLVYAEDLIEARSRWWINSRIIKDYEAADRDSAEESQALQPLLRQNENQSEMSVRPTCF